MVIGYTEVEIKLQSQTYDILLYEWKILTYKIIESTSVSFLLVQEHILCYTFYIIKCYYSER